LNWKKNPVKRAIPHSFTLKEILEKDSRLIEELLNEIRQNIFPFFEKFSSRF